MRAAVPAGIFLVVTILSLVSSLTDPLVIAYCQARCLHENQTNIDDGNNQDCSLPCDLNPSSETDCVNFCQTRNSSCLNSCQFLWRFLSECSSLECLNTTNTKTRQPSIPTNITVKEYHYGSLVHLTWSVNPDQNKNVIFVVQMRWSLLPFVNVTGWETLTKTTASTILLKEVLFPGRWYQFRIAAVSINGTKGFSRESEPFILSIFPRPPAPPTNLREETEGNNYPILRWEPPNSDLPIENYKITWSLRSRGIHTRQMLSREFKRLLPANRLNFTLKQVERGALFLVQVQAVTRFKNHTLFGQKASIFVNTFSLKVSDTKIVLGEITNLTISDPIFNEYNNSLAHVNISWSLNQELVKNVVKFIVKWNVELCKNEMFKRDIYHHTAVTHFSIFTLPNLFLGCKYKIFIQPTKRGIVGDAVTLYVTIPVLPDMETQRPNSTNKNSVLISSIILTIFITFITFIRV